MALMAARTTAASLILMYHRVGNPFVRTIVRQQYALPIVLRAQLQTILGMGYRPLTLSALLADSAAAHGSFAPTFDDGYAGVYTRGYPILAAQGIPATVFVVAGAIGGINEWDIRIGDRVERLLTVGQLRELAQAGWEIGSHSMSHARLTQLPDKQLRAELYGSRVMLEDLLGNAVTSFAYPYGEVDARVSDAVREAGYRNAVTTRQSAYATGMNLLSLPRINMRWTTVGPFLRRKITRFSSHKHIEEFMALR